MIHKIVVVLGIFFASIHLLSILFGSGNVENYLKLFFWLFFALCDLLIKKLK